MIYLDTASTAKYGDIDNIIADTIVNAMRNYWQNPSSLYATNVNKEIEKCRKNVAKFIGANPEEIYFTSGASESNNWAIRGWTDYVYTTSSSFINVITTTIEHKSTLELVKSIEERYDICVEHCAVDDYGIVDYSTLEYLLKTHNGEQILVSVCMANNEIGTIQDIRRIADLVHEYGGVLHVDATQELPHEPVYVDMLCADMMSASGHKFSPVLRGIGFLYKKSGINIRPLIYGSQESNLRGGTENTYGIIGLNKALEISDICYERYAEMCDKRDYFIEQLEAKFGCKLNGDREYRLSNNINVTFPQNITGEALLYTLDLSGIQISTGSACNSREVKPSHVLKAIGLSDEEAMRTVRFTLPYDITHEEIDCVIEEIDKAIRLIEIN